jgi:hypothetical protein
VFEPKRDYRRDREDDGDDLADHAVRGETQPDGQADQGVAQHPPKHRFEEGQGQFTLGDADRSCPDRAVTQIQNSGQMDHRRRRHGAHEIPDIDQAPIARQAKRGDPPIRPGHDDQVVAGEQLGTTHDHQDQAERKRDSAEQACGPEAQITAGYHQGVEHTAERDKRAGQDRQRQGLQNRQIGLFNAGIFDHGRDLRRRIGIGRIVGLGWSVVHRRFLAVPRPLS